MHKYKIKWNTYIGRYGVYKHYRNGEVFLINMFDSYKDAKNYINKQEQNTMTESTIWQKLMHWSII